MSHATLLDYLAGGQADEGTIERLIESAPGTGETDAEGRTALHIAAFVGVAPRVLKRLIEINASDAGLIDNDECLPLHCVCLGKSPSREAITLLHGAFPDGAKASESNGHLPLHAYLEAHEPADPDIVRCLLDLYPAAASVADDGGLLPLHIALRHKATFGVVQMILTANDSAVVYGDGDGFVPLHLALQLPTADSLDTVSLLVFTDKSTTSIVDENENRAMHYAATMATPELVDFLIGIDPDSACAPNDEGQLPLHLACKAKRQTEILDLLMAEFPEGAAVPDQTSTRPMDMSDHVLNLYNLHFKTVMEGDDGEPVPDAPAVDAVATNGGGEKHRHVAPAAAPRNVSAVRKTKNPRKRRATLSDAAGLIAKLDGVVPGGGMHGIEEVRERLGAGGVDVGTNGASAAGAGDASAGAGAGAGAGASSLSEAPQPSSVAASAAVPTVPPPPPSESDVRGRMRALVEGADAEGDTEAATALAAGNTGMQSPAIRVGEGGALLRLLENFENGREARLTPKVVQRLLAEDPDSAHVASPRGELPLHVAVASPFALDVVKLITAAYPGAVKRRDTRGRLPLHFAAGCTSPSLPTVEYMLDIYPAGAASADQDGMLPLHCAVCSTRVTDKIIQALMFANPEGPKTPDKFLRLPLHYACDSPDANVDVIEMLASAFPEALDDEDSNFAMPLHLACSHSNIDPAIVRLLLVRCPDAASFAGEGGNGWLPLHYAVSCQYPQFEVFNLLAAAFPDGLCEPDAEGNHPLHLAVARPRCPLEIVTGLVNADPLALRSRNKDKLLPLHIACKSGASDTVVAELASAYGQALADFPPPELKLPLHYACAHEPPLVGVINVLLDKYPHGVTAEDRSERVPIEIAARNRHVTPKVLQLLCQVDPQWLFKTNSDDPSAARVLVDSGNQDLIEFVRETQQRVPQEMWVAIPEQRSAPHPLDNVQNPLSEQSFIAETPAKRNSRVQFGPSDPSTPHTPRSPPGPRPMKSALKGSAGAGAGDGSDGAGMDDMDAGAGVPSSRAAHGSSRSSPAGSVHSDGAARELMVENEKLKGDVATLAIQVAAMQKRLNDIDGGNGSKKCCCTIM